MAKDLLYDSMADDTPSFESTSVAAILLQRGREDHAALLDDLVAMLAEVVPNTRVERSLFGRRVTAIHLPVGGYVYVLRRGAGDTFEANRRQQVRGVVIKTDPMEIDAFLAELGLALDVELERTEKGRDAVRQWLNGRNPD
jgi:hypothetical protein